MSGQTENHLLLVNLVGKSINGKQADEALGHAHITVNKNSIPDDPLSPMITSGIRLGTPAVTTRGFTESQMQLVGTWIADVLDAFENPKVIAEVRTKVLQLCRQFPVYG